MNHWPHAPLHMFNNTGTYMVTASTLHKHHLFKEPAHLDMLQDTLFELTLKYSWTLEAWALFSNHYHIIVQSQVDPTNLPKFIAHLHTHTARVLNRYENAPGRAVWYQYWDTRLTYQASYLARLNYVMQNPVRHKIVTDATLYKWCSMAWFDEKASRAYKQSVLSLKTDRVNIEDDF